MVKQLQDGQRDRLHEVIAANSKVSRQPRPRRWDLSVPCHAKLLGLFVRVCPFLTPFHVRSMHTEAFGPEFHWASDPRLTSREKHKADAPAMVVCTSY